MKPPVKPLTQKRVRELFDYTYPDKFLIRRERPLKEFKSKRLHARWNGQWAGQHTQEVRIRIDGQLYPVPDVIKMWVRGTGVSVNDILPKKKFSKVEEQLDILRRNGQIK